MKKLFIAASLLIGMIAGVMVLSSFCDLQENVDKERSSVCIQDNFIWEGAAYCIDCGGIVYAYIRVYQGQDGHYYALDRKDNKHIVKENPGYSRSNSKNLRQYKYYIYIKSEDSNFYFNITNNQ